MKYAVQLTRSARKDVLALEDPLYSRISEAINALEENPRPEKARKLRGREKAWRIRVGDHRVIYEVDDDSHAITIYTVKHRREVYRG